MAKPPAPVGRTCRPCQLAADKHTILMFKRTANLCPGHKAMYNKERERELAREAKKP